MSPWLASMPDEILDAKNCNFYNVQFKHTVGHPEITSNDMIDLLIKARASSGETLSTANSLLSEIEASMIDLFGADGETRKVSVYNTIGQTVGRVANRVFVGKELCSNEELVMSGDEFAQAVCVSGVILHFSPKFMRPYVHWISD
ncbi:hypothetical protein DFH09DRAFT_927760 [Mycena vulgaris]|nr:hypothetical protein DFH09DRAFT_927760 [Mycena vulgaris]